MPDGWEVQYNLNPLNATDANEDADSDGLTNLEEYTIGTWPNATDTDSDGFKDGEEVAANTDPLNPNSHPSEVALPFPIHFIAIVLAVAFSVILLIFRKKKFLT